LIILQLSRKRPCTCGPHAGGQRGGGRKSVVEILDFHKGIKRSLAIRKGRGGSSWSGKIRNPYLLLLGKGKTALFPEDQKGKKWRWRGGGQSITTLRSSAREKRRAARGPRRRKRRKGASRTQDILRTSVHFREGKGEKKITAKKKGKRKKKTLPPDNGVPPAFGGG